MSVEVERSKETTAATIHRLEDSIKQHLADLERRFNQRLGDLHQQVVHSTTECTEERNRLEERILDTITKAIDAVQQRIVSSRLVFCMTICYECITYIWICCLTAQMNN